MLKLSLIIPVYNEERHIKACLDAVSKQSVLPNEVIVVDNNCTDNTINIAKKYPFVRVITEKNQGRGFARSTGFNAAKHEIIGRIDADSRIASDWVEQVVAQFSGDDDLMGLTGLGKTATLPGISMAKNTVISRNYYWFVHAGFNTITMWGANMALRNSAWRSVRSLVCLDDNAAHEDQDLSLWIAAGGGKIEQNNNMIVTIDGQSYRYLPKLIHYSALFRKTKKMHTENGNLRAKKLPRIGFLKSLPGRLINIPYGIALFAVSILFFPLDFLISNYTNNSTWLD